MKEAASDVANCTSTAVGGILLWCSPNEARGMNKCGRWASQAMHRDNVF